MLPFAEKHLATKFENVWTSLKSASATFNNIDSGISTECKEKWLNEEKMALNQRVAEPSAMDIFQMQTIKVYTVKDTRVLLYSLQQTYPQYYLDGQYSRRDQCPSR